jgi:hypothetical protein
VEGGHRLYRHQGKDRSDGVGDAAWKSVSGGSSNSRSGRDAKDLLDGDDGGDSSSLRSGKLSLDIDGELGGGKRLGI